MDAIVVMGNLGAGKTAMGMKLEAEGWARLVIDDFRPNASAENEARAAMLRAIHAAAKAGKNIVYETTTANVVHGRAMKALEVCGYSITRMKLPISEELSRVRHTGTSPWGKTHAESFAYIEAKLRGEWCDVVFDENQREEFLEAIKKHYK
jgi:hypothetical protein